MKNALDQIVASGSSSMPNANVNLSLIGTARKIQEITTVQLLDNTISKLQGQHHIFDTYS